jgi:hypothetical protein
MYPEKAAGVKTQPPSLFYGVSGWQMSRCELQLMRIAGIARIAGDVFVSNRQARIPNIPHNARDS